MRREDFVAFGEEGFVEFVADSFQHFDGRDFIKFAGDEPVVLDTNFDEVGESGIFDSRARISCLGLGDGDRGDFAAVIFRCVMRESAPTAADFQDVIGGFDVELAA